MSERVPMVHPNLPGRRIHVRPAGVESRRRSGWLLESELPTRPLVVDEPQPEPRRRRRTEPDEGDS